MAEPEVDISRGQVIETLVISAMIVMIDEGCDLCLKVLREVVVSNRIRFLSGWCQRSILLWACRWPGCWVSINQAPSAMRAATGQGKPVRPADQAFSKLNLVLGCQCLVLACQWRRSGPASPATTQPPGHLKGVAAYVIQDSFDE